MYVEPNFPTKKALKQAIATGQEVMVFQPGPFPTQTDGAVTVEGPHYPKPHRWYARVEVQSGRVVKVIE